MTTPKRATLCLSCDNMGQARAIAEGSTGRPDYNEIGLVVGFPRVLDLFDALNIKATFFVEAWNCLHHPDKVTELVKRGHEIALHGFAHEKFAELSEVRAEQIFYDGTAAFRALGIKPVGFRPPGGALGEFGVKLMEELGYQYDSSLQGNDTLQSPLDDIAQPYFTSPKIVALPFRWKMVDGYIFRMNPGPRTPQYMEELWKTQLENCVAKGETMTIIFHPYISGTDDERFGAMKRFLTYAVNHSGVDVTTLGPFAAKIRVSMKSG